MASRNEDQKRIESWFLNEARSAGVPIPHGEIPSEEPDFKFVTSDGALGIELCEVLRPASSNFGNLPVEEESVHREIVKGAQQLYYKNSNTKPVHVRASFTNTKGQKHNKKQLTAALAEFVQANAGNARPAANFGPSAGPNGFDWVHLDTELDPEDWISSEAGGISLAEIRPAVEARIAAKNKLIGNYRANLPAGASVWLLLYSSVTVARSIPIPIGAEQWCILSGFDRVFWFTSLDRQFIEFRRPHLI